MKRLFIIISTDCIPLTLVVGYETAIAVHLIFNSLHVCGIIVKYTNYSVINHIWQEKEGGSPKLLCRVKYKYKLLSLVEFAVGCLLALKVFCSRSVFLHLKKTLSNSNSILIEEPHENQLRLMWLSLKILRPLFLPSDLMAQSQCQNVCHMPETLPCQS